MQGTSASVQLSHYQVFNRHSLHQHVFNINPWSECAIKVATTKAQRKLFFTLRKLKKRLGCMNAAEVTAIAKDWNVSEREVREMESRLSGRDIGFDAPDDDDNDHRPPSPDAFLQAYHAEPALAFEHDNHEDNQLEVLRKA